MLFRSDTDLIKTAKEELEKKFMDLSQRIYQAQQQQQNPEPAEDAGGESAGGADFVDADFKEAE